MCSGLLESYIFPSVIYIIFKRFAQMQVKDLIHICENCLSAETLYVKRSAFASSSRRNFYPI